MLESFNEVTNQEKKIKGLFRKSITRVSSPVIFYAGHPNKYVNRLNPRLLSLKTKLRDSSTLTKKIADFILPPNMSIVIGPIIDIDKIAFLNSN